MILVESINSSPIEKTPILIFLYNGIFFIPTEAKSAILNSVIRSLELNIRVFFFKSSPIFFMSFLDALFLSNINIPFFTFTFSRGTKYLKFLSIVAPVLTLYAKFLSKFVKLEPHDISFL